MPDTLNPKTVNNPVPSRNPGTPSVDDPKKNREESDKQMERVADKAAHKAAKTEQEYDKQHTEMSK